MLPRFPRYDFEGALDMAKRSYELGEEFEKRIPRIREARDAMLQSWRGPYGDFLYRHCLENDLENHSIIREISSYGDSWLHQWRAKVNETNIISFKQAAYHQSQWDYWYGRNDFGWGLDWQPPIEARNVDGRFLAAPQWRNFHSDDPYARTAPDPPDAPDFARPPVRFAPAEPPFVYYELEGIRWNLIYSYQVPIAAPESHGAGPRPRQILPLRPWSLPVEQGSSYENSIDLALVREYLITSKRILVSLRAKLGEFENLWRAFERRSECPNRSDCLKYADMVLSEMWRTRQFVKKVRARLEAGEEFGSFEIPMPEWNSTPGTRRPPPWYHRGARFEKLASEAGLVTRYGSDLTYDPDDERREKAYAEDAKRRAEYAAYLAAHDRMVAEDIARTLGAEAGPAPQDTSGGARGTGGPSGVPGTTPGQSTSRRYIAGPWYATDEPILDVPGADYPYYDAERDGPLFVEWKDGERVIPGEETVPVSDPVIAAVPAVAQPRSN